MNTNAARKIALESADIIWFVARGSVLKGPFTSEQLNAQLVSQSLQYTDFCWRQGFREWRPIASVEDFERRANLQLIPSYPTVEVPSAGLGGAQDYSRSRTFVGSKRIEVELSKSRRHSISIYEWGAAAVFSMVFAYLAASFALQEVSNKFLYKVSIMKMGGLKQVGREAVKGEDRVNPLFLAPLWSAPSLADMSNQAIPVISYGVPKQVNGKLTINDFEVTSLDGSLAPTSDNDDVEVDPVYVKPHLFLGSLSPKTPQQIDVNDPSDPRLVNSL